MRIQTLTLLPALALLAGCAADLDADATSALAVANTRSALENGARSMAFMGATSVVPQDCMEEVCPEPAPFDWQEDIDLLVDFLEAEVFVTANVESVEGGAVTYLLGSAAFCADALPEEQADCIQQMDTLQLRLVASSPSEGDLDVHVLVGAEKHHPLTLRLHADELGVAVDLAGVAGTLEVAEAINGAPIDLPDTLQGAFDLALKAEGAQVATLTLAVTQAIEATDAADGVSLSLGASPAALEVTFDGVQEQVTGAVSLGPVDLALPGEDLWPGLECTLDPVTYEETCTATRPPLSGQVVAHLAGLTGTTTFTAAQEVLEVLGLGLGDETSWITYAGEPLVSIDLNAELGRTVDVTVVPSEDPGVDTEVTLDPGLIVSASFDSTTLAAEDPNLFADWTAGETLTVAFTGETAPTVRSFIFADDGTGTIRNFQMLAGTYSLTSASRGESLVVEAGMCSWDDLQALGTHPLDGTFAAACE